MCERVQHALRSAWLARLAFGLLQQELPIIFPPSATAATAATILDFFVRVTAARVTAGLMELFAFGVTSFAVNDMHCTYTAPGVSFFG